MGTILTWLFWAEDQWNSSAGTTVRLQNPLADMQSICVQIQVFPLILSLLKHFLLYTITVSSFIFDCDSSVLCSFAVYVNMTLILINESGALSQWALQTERLYSPRSSVSIYMANIKLKYESHFSLSPTKSLTNLSRINQNEYQLINFASQQKKTHEPLISQSLLCMVLHIAYSVPVIVPYEILCVLSATSFAPSNYYICVPFTFKEVLIWWHCFPWRSPKWWLLSSPTALVCLALEMSKSLVLLLIILLE